MQTTRIMLFAITLYACLALTPAAQDSTPDAKTEPQAESPTAVQEPEVDDSWHPSGVEEFQQQIGVKKIWFHQWPGLELYCDNSKLHKQLVKTLDVSWPQTLEFLGGSPFPKGRILRVVALNEAEHLQAYFEVLGQGARLAGIAAPPESLYKGLLKSGSATLNLPPTALLRPNYVGKSTAPSRVVHDTAAMSAAWACSYSGYGAPEFLTEGFAGMILRRAIKKPAALVSHENAALSETIQGYGVFAGIGAAMNNADNSPANWPRFMHNAIKKMRKSKKSDPAERVDSLLLRTRTEFARSDYPYAWSAMEFLFDTTPMETLAITGTEAAATTEEIEAPASRRRGLHRVLTLLRAPKLSASEQKARSAQFRELLLAEYGEDSLAMHQAFLNWAVENLPKR
jgi:hypothetical protein